MHADSVPVIPGYLNKTCTSQTKNGCNASVLRGRNPHVAHLALFTVSYAALLLPEWLPQTMDVKGRSQFLCMPDNWPRLLQLHHPLQVPAAPHGSSWLAAHSHQNTTEPSQRLKKKEHIWTIYQSSKKLRERMRKLKGTTKIKCHWSWKNVATSTSSSRRDTNYTST